MANLNSPSKKRNANYDEEALRSSKRLSISLPRSQTSPRRINLSPHSSLVNTSPRSSLSPPRTRPSIVPVVPVDTIVTTGATNAAVSVAATSPKKVKLQYIPVVVPDGGFDSRLCEGCKLPYRTDTYMNLYCDTCKHEESSDTSDVESHLANKKMQCCKNCEVIFTSRVPKEQCDTCYALDVIAKNESAFNVLNQGKNVGKTTAEATLVKE